jgi:flavorubredoxin
MTNTNKTKKMTKKDYFNALLNIPEVGTNAELVAFIEHELELLERKSEKKANGEKKLTATQIENEKLKEIILEFMEPNTLYSIAELQKKVSELSDLSNQKIASLLRQMLPENGTGELVRVEDKRKVYYKLA